MRTPSQFPARAAFVIRIPRPATSMPFVFPARRNGHVMTEIMRPASLILISHNPGDGPVIPRVPLVLTGPAGPSVPQVRSTGKVSGAGWPGPGPDRSGLWLRNAAAGLCVLAAAAAAATPLTVLGGLALWLLRLALAPASTLAGFRAWVIQECPVAPGRRAPAHRPASAPPPRKATKTARFLDLATERHGSFASIPLPAVAGISADLAPLIGLHPGTARAALRKAVLTAKNGASR